MAKAMARPLDQRPLWRRLLPARMRWSWLFTGVVVLSLLVGFQMLPTLSLIHI